MYSSIFKKAHPRVIEMAGFLRTTIASIKKKKKKKRNTEKASIY